MPPSHTTNSPVPTAAGRPTAIMEAQISTVSAMNATVNAPKNRWIRFSMMNIRARRTSVSMRVNARNVTARRPVIVPKNPRKTTITQRSAMAGRTLVVALPLSGRYIYRSECSLLSLTAGGDWIPRIQMRQSGSWGRSPSRAEEGRFRLQRFTAFPAKGCVFRFQIATVSALDFHDFLRRRRTPTGLARRPAGRREGLLHVRLEHVGRHRRPASHGTGGPTHHRGHERAAEHRPSEPDQRESESPHGVGEIPSTGAHEARDIPGIRRRADVRIELACNVGRITEDDEARDDENDYEKDHPAAIARPIPLRAHRSLQHVDPPRPSMTGCSE